MHMENFQECYKDGDQECNRWVGDLLPFYSALLDEELKLKTVYLYHVLSVWLDL